MKKRDFDKLDRDFNRLLTQTIQLYPNLSYKQLEEGFLIYSKNKEIAKEFLEKNKVECVRMYKSAKQITLERILMYNEEDEEDDE